MTSRSWELGRTAITLRGPPAASQARPHQRLPGAPQAESPAAWQQETSVEATQPLLRAHSLARLAHSRLLTFAARIFMLCELKRALPHYCLAHGSFAGSAHNSRPWVLSSCSASSRDSCERKRICAHCSSGLHDMLEKGCYWKHPQRKSRCCRATSSSPAFAQPRQLTAHGGSNLDAVRAQAGLATLLYCTWLICRINSQLPALGFVKLRCKLTRKLREEEDMHRLLEWP